MNVMGSDHLRIREIEIEELFIFRCRVYYKNKGQLSCLLWQLHILGSFDGYIFQR
jgi:hypothetical protein